MTADGLRIASYGAKSGFRLDRAEDLLPNYSRVAVGTVLTTPEELQRLTRWVDTFVDLEDTPFVVSGPLMGPIHLMGRRSRNPLVVAMVTALMWLYCALQRWRFGSRAAYVCSTFAWSAQRESRAVPLRVPLSAQADDLLANTNSDTRRDDELARWLCGPTELWDALSPFDRWDLDLSAVQETVPETTLVAA